MPRVASDPSVLHINDVARIGTHLCVQARREGLDWSLVRLARTDPCWRGWKKTLGRAWRGAAWEARLGRAAWGVDLINLHGGNIRRHTGWLPHPYVLHLHGSDVRTVRVESEAQRRVIDGAIERAREVYYTTPDLREPTCRLRPDALLQPVVVDVNELPTCSSGGVPTVVFPSRWDRAKGGDLQLEVARQLRRALGQHVRFEGLDWGEGAALAARQAGVTLVPRMSHARYIEWLSRGTVAVGQVAGILSVSELEVMGMDIPLVAPLNPLWYDGSHESLTDVPVGCGPVEARHAVDAVVAATRELLENPILPARGWVEKIHGPRAAVSRLRGRYRAVMGG